MSDIEEFTKARIKYERALAALARLEIVVNHEMSKARREVHQWATVASRHAEGAGYCSCCFKPLNEGSHDGPDHVVMAGVTDLNSEGL